MKPEKISQILLVLLILTLFFPTRHVFDLPGNFITGAYSDFTSFSLYSSDILAVAFILYAVFKGMFRQKPTKVLFALTAWLILSFFLNIKQEIGLNWYFLSRFGLLLVLHETLRHEFLDYGSIVPKVFVLGGVLESFLALFQFIYQKSLGLYFFGEQHLDILTLGIAKLGVGPLKVIRAYGTFPHSNLLSAFLLTSLFFSLLLVTTTKTRITRIIYASSLIVITVGLFLTFSRAAFLGAFIGLAIYFGMIFAKKQLSRQILITGAIICLSALACIMVLKPFLLARTELLSDQSAKERIFYAKVGLEMIKANPLSGKGIGTSVLHMKQYSPVELQPWEIQPIHNYFLLAAAEFGIIGAIIILILLLTYLYRLFLLVNYKFSFYHLTLLCIFAGFLVLMQFDHYFYTIEQTQILLWLVLGLIAAEVYSVKQKTPR